jgi:FkbM family methyltransferase
MTIKTKKIDNLTFSFINEKEFEFLYFEIFKMRMYSFTASIPDPFILDCGAHIGMSVLYFKTLYPQAKIIAFEPNPEAFKLLELNIKQNNLKDVELVNAALSNITGEIDFYIRGPAASPSTWSVGGSAVKRAGNDDPNIQTIKVPAVKLSSYINRPVDLLKIDVEGMEEIILEEIEGKLEAVKEIRMELHGISNECNNPERVMSLLGRNGFKFLVRQSFGKDAAGSKLLRTVRRLAIRTDQVEFIGIDQSDNPYILFMYGSRRRSALWWHALILAIWHRIQSGATPEGVD